MRKKLSEMDFELIEEKAAGLLLLEVDLFNKIGTAGEAEAKKRLTEGIQELNMLLEGETSPRELRSFAGTHSRGEGEAQYTGCENN